MPRFNQPIGRPNTRQGQAQPNTPWKMTFGDREGADLQAYIERYETHIQSCHWDDDNKIAALCATLRGTIRDMVVTIPSGLTWSNFRQSLLDIWEPPERREAMRATFAITMRNRKEKSESYLQRLILSAQKAFGKYPEYVIEDMVKRQFLAGQTSAVRNRFAWYGEPTTSEMLSAVVRLEASDEQERQIGVRRTETAYEPEQAGPPISL